MCFNKLLEIMLKWCYSMKFGVKGVEEKCWVILVFDDYVDEKCLCVWLLVVIVCWLVIVWFFFGVIILIENERINLLRFIKYVKIGWKKNYEGWSVLIIVSWKYYGIVFC